jgi:hypothetical protein
MPGSSLTRSASIELCGSRLFRVLLDQTEPPCEGTGSSGLQEQGCQYRKRYEGDRDLRSLHAPREQQTGHGGRDDTSVAGPTEEGEFFSGPSAAPIWEQAG